MATPLTARLPHEGPKLTHHHRPTINGYYSLKVSVDSDRRTRMDASTRDEHILSPESSVSGSISTACSPAKSPAINESECSTAGSEPTDVVAYAISSTPSISAAQGFPQALQVLPKHVRAKMLAERAGTALPPRVATNGCICWYCAHRIEPSYR